ncbi:MAG TPA: ABC transporter permease subunit [Verrucomicrobiae bacterium]|nr:ABC transporter permease subunit [Verrucomicrobiae bacterium]
MKTIFLIATDSIRALLYQRLLLGLMVASLALTIVFSILMSSARKNITAAYSSEATHSATATTAATNGMSATEQKRFRASMEQASSFLQAEFYAMASGGGEVVSLFIFSLAVTSEIRRGTIRLTLSKPVSRLQFLLGKYLGGVVVMAGYAMLTCLAIFIFAQSQGLELNPAVKWAPWLMFCDELILGSVAMLLSLFVHPLVASVLALFGGNGLCSLHNPLYYLLPSYQDFSVFSQVLQGSLLSWKDVLFLSLYALDFVIIMLLLALWRFRAKELI